MLKTRALSLAVVVIAATALAGCASSSGSGSSNPYVPAPYGNGYVPAPYGNAYGPYDPETNSDCGAVGNCYPTNPIRLGPHDGALGG
jgi:hypothetical protein